MSIEGQTTIPVYIKGEVVIIDGIKQYHVASTNIAEMSNEVLREIIIELMEEQTK